MATNEGKAARILAAIRAGAETVRDIEAELDFTMPANTIGAHVAQLKRQGRIVVVGRITLPTERTRNGRAVEGSTVRAFQYRAAESNQS